VIMNLERLSALALGRRGWHPAPQLPGGGTITPPGFFHSPAPGASAAGRLPAIRLRFDAAVVLPVTAGAAAPALFQPQNRKETLADLTEPSRNGSQVFCETHGRAGCGYGPAFPWVSA